MAGMGMEDIIRTDMAGTAIMAMQKPDTRTTRPHIVGIIGGGIMPSRIITPSTTGSIRGIMPPGITITRNHHHGWGHHYGWDHHHGWGWGWGGWNWYGGGVVGPSYVDNGYVGPNVNVVNPPLPPNGPAGGVGFFSLVGTIRSIKGTAIAVASEDGDPVTIATTPDTKIVLNSRQATLADLQPQDRVKVRYDDALHAMTLVAIRS